jgi:NitT/TauT family transport system substrate-binding protein
MKYLKFLLLIVVGSIIVGGCAVQQAKQQATPVVEVIQEETAQPEEPTAQVLEPIKIKLGVFPYASFVPLYIAEVEGFFDEQGLDVEFVDFRQPTDMLVSLATKQIDISATVLDVATLAAISEGTGIKIVADKGYIDPESTCTFAAWMVQKDLLASGELDDLNNLAGKKVILTKTSFFEYAMDRILTDSDLTLDDLEIVELPAPARLEALETKAVDISQAGEPWITRTLSADLAEIWMPFEDILPGDQYAVLFYGPSVINDNPEVGYRFMNAYLKALQQYNQGKTERNIALMAEFTNSSIEEATDICWQTFTADGSVNLDTVLDFQQWANNKGYLDKTLTLDEIWDGRFLEKAQENLP